MARHAWCFLLLAELAASISEYNTTSHWAVQVPISVITANDRTTAICNGGTGQIAEAAQVNSGQWVPVFGDERAFESLEFAVRLDVLNGGGSAANVCVGVAPHDFVPSTTGFTINSNAFIMCFGNHIYWDPSQAPGVYKMTGTRKWMQGETAVISYSMDSKQITWSFGESEKFTLNLVNELRPPVSAVVFMWYQNDQVTLVPVPTTTTTTETTNITTTSNYTTTTTTSSNTSTSTNTTLTATSTSVTTSNTTSTTSTTTTSTTSTITSTTITTTTTTTNTTATTTTTLVATSVTTFTSTTSTTTTARTTLSNITTTTSEATTLTSTSSTTTEQSLPLGSRNNLLEESESDDEDSTLFLVLGGAAILCILATICALLCTRQGEGVKKQEITISNPTVSGDPVLMPPLNIDLQDVHIIPDDEEMVEYRGSIPFQTATSSGLFTCTSCPQPAQQAANLETVSRPHMMSPSLAVQSNGNESALDIAHGRISRSVDGAAMGIHHWFEEIFGTR